MQELKLPVKGKIEILSAAAIGNQLKIIYKCKSVAKSSLLNFALVKKTQTTNVKRGENMGRKLTGYNIVIDFATQPLKESGLVVFPFDKEKIALDYNVVVYIQEMAGGAILAAAISEIK